MGGYNPQASAMGLDTAETNPAVLRKMTERKKRMHSKRIDEARRRGRVGGQGFESFGRTGKRSSTAPQPRRPSSEKLPDIGAPRQPLEDESNRHYDDPEGAEEPPPCAMRSPTAFGEGAHDEESLLSRQERAMAMHAKRRERMALAEEKRRRRQLGEDAAAADDEDFVPFSAQGRRQQQQRARDIANVARHVNSAPTSARASNVGGGSSYEHMEAERTIAELRQQLADAPGRAAAAAKAEMLSAKRAAKTARNKCAELEQKVAELETELAKEREEKAKLARRLAAQRKKQSPGEGGGNGEGGHGTAAGSEVAFDERAARVLANAKEAAATVADTAARARATITAAASATSPAPSRMVATPDHDLAAVETPPPAQVDNGPPAQLGNSQEQESAADVPVGSALRSPIPASSKPAQAVHVSSVSVSAQPPPARRGRAAAQPGGGRRARRQEKTPQKVASPVKEEPEERQAPEHLEEAEAELTGEWALPPEEPLSIASALAAAAAGATVEPDEGDDEPLALLRERHARSQSEASGDGSDSAEQEASEEGSMAGAMLWGDDADSDLAPRALLSGGLDASLMSEGIFDNDTNPSGAQGFSPVSGLVDGVVEGALSEATNTGSSWAEAGIATSPIPPSMSPDRAKNERVDDAPKSPGSSQMDQHQEELNDLVRELMEEQPHLTREECEAAVKDAMGGRRLVPNDGYDLTEVEEQEEDEAAEAEESVRHTDHRQEQDDASEDAYSDDDEQFESTGPAEEVDKQQQQQSQSPSPNNMSI